MKSKFYEIKNKVVTNINIIPLNNYLKKHNFQAPPIPFGVKTIKRNIFNKIEKIFLPSLDFTEISIIFIILIILYITYHQVHVKVGKSIRIAVENKFCVLKVWNRSDKINIGIWL